MADASFCVGCRGKREIELRELSLESRKTLRLRIVSLHLTCFIGSTIRDKTVETLSQMGCFRTNSTSLDRNKIPFSSIAIPKPLIKFKAGFVDATLERVEGAKYEEYYAGKLHFEQGRKFVYG